MGNKNDKCIAAGGASALVAILAIPIIVSSGGLAGVALGGALMSGGVSGGFNAHSQYKDPNKKDFSLKNFTGHVGVNAVVGAASGGIGGAFTTTSTLGRIGISALSSGGLNSTSKVVTNKIDGKKGKDVLEGVLTAGIFGAVGGAVATGVTQGANKLIGEAMSATK